MARADGPVIWLELRYDMPPQNLLPQNLPSQMNPPESAR
jgi:hypothetical protein